MAFPPSPGPNATHQQGGATWRWDGQKWTSVTTPVTAISVPVASMPSWSPRNVQRALQNIDRGVWDTDGGNGGNGGDVPSDHWPEPATGRMYYIASNGSDTNPGTKDSPWATVTRVNSHVKQPGDAFMFRSTDTFTGQGIHAIGDAASGTAASPIFYRSYGPRTSRATIRPGSNAISGSLVADMRDCGVYLRNASYNRVRDLIIIGTGRTQDTNHGLYFEASSQNLNRYPGNEIHNLDISACGRRGLVIVTSTIQSVVTTVNPGFDDLVIQDCSIHDNNDGMAVWGRQDDPVKQEQNQHRNLLVRNCRVYNNTWARMWVVGGINISGVDGGLIENCVAYGNGVNSPDGPVGIWCHDCNNVVFRYCESYNNSSNNTDGGGFDIDGGATNCVFEYCYSHDNRGPGLQYWVYYQAPYTGNNTFRFCVSQNDARASGYPSVHLGSSDTTRPVTYYGKCTYHNCAIYQSQNREMVQLNPAFRQVYSDFFNNIFVAAGASRFVAGGNSTYLRFNGNNYAGSAQFNWHNTNYANVAAWRGGNGSPETLAGANTAQTWAHGLNNAGNGGTITPVGQWPTAAMFHGWTPYQLTTGSQNRRAGLNLTQHFSINPGPQDLFGNPVQATALSIGAHSPP